MSSDIFSFPGRSAVVTGAGAGIGRAFAQALGREGMRLLLADRDGDGVATLARELRDEGCEAHARILDVTDAGAVAALADEADRLFGGTDLLCNNAGITTPNRWRRVWEFGVDEWRAMLEVNLMGVVHGINSFVPRMIARGTPARVLNTASAAGLISGSGSVPYGMSKVAVVRVSEGLYAGLREEGHPIGVTVLCPGLVRTAIFDRTDAQPDLDENGRFRFTPGTQSPEEVAAMAVDAVRNGRFYLITNGDFDRAIAERTEAILARRNPAFTAELKAQGREAAPR